MAQYNSTTGSLWHKRAGVSSMSVEPSESLELRAELCIPTKCFKCERAKAGDESPFLPRCEMDRAEPVTAVQRER